MKAKTVRYSTIPAWAVAEHGLRYPRDFRDSRKGVWYEVAERHCKEAVRRNALWCAMKLAIIEAEGGNPDSPEVVDVAVMKRTVGIVYSSGKHKMCVRYLLGEKFREAQREFEWTGVFPPGRYWLRPVNPSNRLVALGAPRTRGIGRGPHHAKTKNVVRQYPGTRVGIEVIARRRRAG